MRIEVDRTEALFDQPITIRVRDCAPGAAVTLRASAIDDLAHRWESDAVFVADANGAIDVGGQVAASGTYPGRDAMGLFWSMRLDPAIAERRSFVKTSATPVKVTITAEQGNDAVSLELTRRFMGPGVRRREIRENGLVATFFDHETGARPGVIVMTGSNGGLAEDQAALLASRGYAVLALAYFAMESLPPDLVGIPLEYFDRAIKWMRANQSVDGDRVAVIGASRGGELALLLGATFPEIKAVAAYVPSGVLWEGIASTPSPEPKSAWTLDGQALAFVKSHCDPTPRTKSPVALMPLFEEALRQMDRAKWPEIEVEKISGPILMFSGSDDQLWPSLMLADIAVQRLLRSKFPHRFDHITYAGAGHMIRFPYSPVITEAFHPVVRTMLALGGDLVANAAADHDSWERLLAFLAAAV